MAGFCKLKYQSFYFSIIFWLIYHSLIYYQKLRSSHRRSSVRKGALRNFAKFIGKHLYQRLFFNKVANCNFITKESPAQVFSCEFCEISKNIFFTEHLWTTASEKCQNCRQFISFQIEINQSIKITKNFIKY